VIAPDIAPKVLVVEDDRDQARGLVSVLEQARYAVTHSACGQPAVEQLEREVYDLVLLCACAPGLKGLFVLSRARALQTQAQFLILTDEADIGTAVEAMRLGAYDYLSKPVRPDVLLLRVSRAVHQGVLSREVAGLKVRAGRSMRRKLLGSSPAIEQVFRLIERVAPTVASVLVTGETGTGKELVARAVHDLSPRRGHPFVPVSCSALPENLLESELFGHVRGSFTGAVTNRRGLFEDAAGGTIFLDEIETLGLAMQAKLLRAVEERTIQRVGARHDIPVNFRLIAASNADLATLVEQGLFREDLYYRLNVFPIHVPPLRHRPNDIPILTQHFVNYFAKDAGIPPPDIGEATLDKLVRYPWPGNVRELRNVIERGSILSHGKSELVIQLADLPENGDGACLAPLVVEKWDLKQVEGEYIRAVLQDTGGNRNQAARVLGIDRRTLYRKIRELAE
jgi:DNA-binding NtrC family response regulator